MHFKSLPLKYRIKGLLVSHLILGSNFYLRLLNYYYSAAFNFFLPVQKLLLVLLLLLLLCKVIVDTNTDTSFASLAVLNIVFLCFYVGCNWVNNIQSESHITGKKRCCKL